MRCAATKKGRQCLRAHPHDGLHVFGVLRRVSRKQARRIREVAKHRPEIIERSGGRCEGAFFSPLCTGIGTDLHHVRKRRVGDDSPENLRLVCRPCHMAIEAEPQRAWFWGLSERAEGARS